MSGFGTSPENASAGGSATSAAQTDGTQKTQVVDGSGNVAPVGDTAAHAQFVKLTDGTNTAAVKAASTAATTTDPAEVVSLSPNSPSPLTVDRAAAGTIVLNNDAIAISTVGLGVVSISITGGSWTGTIVFESFDGVAWTALVAVPLVGGIAISSTTVNGNWRTNIAGSQQFRVRASGALSGGSATINLEGSQAVAGNYSLIRAKFNSTPATITDGQTTEVQATSKGILRTVLDDGTNVLLPASTALADGESNATLVSRIGARLEAFNGTTWDRIASGLTGVQTTFVGLLNTIPLARFNSTPPTLADGNVAPVQADAKGNTKVAPSDSAGAAIFPAVSAMGDAESNATTISRLGVRLEGFNGTSWDRIATGLTGVQTTFVGVLNSLGMGRYNVTLPAPADGNIVPLQVDSRAVLRVAEQYAPGYENNADAAAMIMETAIASITGAWTNTSSASAGVGTAGVSLKATAGRLRSLNVTNVNATTGCYAQIFNKASAPVNGDVPVDRKWIPSLTIAGQGGDATKEIQYPGGLYLATGVAIAFSTTVGTLTLLGATDAHYLARWV